jgi:hypothetical protein
MLTIPIVTSEGQRFAIRLGGATPEYGRMDGATFVRERDATAEEAEKAKRAYWNVTDE